MKRIKRVVVILLAAVFACGLCGCTSFGAPATTEELLVRYVANENVSNFGATAQVNLSVKALGIRAAIPTTTTLRTANNTAHGTIEIDLSSLDTRNYTMEFYAELLDDALNCYIGTPSGESTTWKLWKIDMTSKIDIFTITELLSSSELTMIAKSSDPDICYELAVPLTKVLATTFDVTAGPAEVGGMDEQSMLDVVKDDKVRVGFTKDCLMRLIDTGTLVTVKNESTNNVQVQTGIDVSVTLDDYGAVDPAEVAIPDEVRSSAVRTDAPVDVLEVIGADSPLAGAVG